VLAYYLDLVLRRRPPRKALTALMVLAIGLNLLLMQHFEMDRLPILYVLVGVVVVMALGQAAVFVPARRAADVPPVVATRSV
jgi:putative ABC transport system permease protein